MTDWYALDFEDEGTQRLIVQARLFAGTEQNPGNLGNNPYDHWHWEIFLQRRDLVPISQAAAELAMSVAQFRGVIAALPAVELDRSFPDPLEHTTKSNSVVRKDFLRDFHKTFPDLRRVTFADYPSYINRLHSQIRSTLNVPVETILDRTDLALGENDPQPGHSVDFITGDLVGLSRLVYIENKKPFELEFDSCSLLTYAHFEDQLRDVVAGHPREIEDRGLLNRLLAHPLRA